MAASWKEAKECAEQVGLSHVYHDYDNGIYGACREGEMQGSFKEGVFIEHRCICMPSHLGADEMDEKEKKFRSENPDW
jgi:hypothetical protein